MSTDILWRSGNAVEVLSFCLTAFLYYSFHRSVSDSVSDRNAEREIWQNGSLFCMFLLFCDQPSVPLRETEREGEEESCEQTEDHLKDQLPAASSNRVCRHQSGTAALLRLCGLIQHPWSFLSYVEEGNNSYFLRLRTELLQLDVKHFSSFILILLCFTLNFWLNLFKSMKI